MDRQCLTRLLWLFASAGGLGALCMASPVGTVRMPSRFAVPTSMVPVERKVLPLNVQEIAMRDPFTGEFVRRTVQLQKTEYQCQLFKKLPDEVVDWSGRLTCYELVTEEPYTWAYWPDWTPLAAFTVLNVEDGKTYLACV